MLMIRGWPGKYTTQVTADQVGTLMSRFQGEEKPWFIWWNPVAPHHGWPIESDDIRGQEPSGGDRSIWQSPARPDSVKGKFDEFLIRGRGVPPSGQPESDRSDKPGYLLGRLAKLPDPAEELYVSVLSRLPTKEEAAEVAELCRVKEDRPAALQDLLWALIASAEFRFNH